MDQKIKKYNPAEQWNKAKRTIEQLTDHQMDSMVEDALNLILPLSEIVDPSRYFQIVEEIAGLSEITINDLGLGNKSLIAILLYYPSQFEQITRSDLRKRYGHEVETLLDGLKKINSLNTSKTRIHSQKFIELLLSISQDVRVVLIKTGERLYHLRHSDRLSREETLKLAHESADLYGPITHRLGLYLIKTEFEDFSLRQLEPQVYHDILDKLNEGKSDRELYIQKFIEPLREYLGSKGFTCDIKGRPKSIHSIWRKMVAQKVDFEEVYDLFAIRVILTDPGENEKSDCWQVYSIVTDLYQPNPNRLRDWISTPKLNGYESLHTTVIGPDGRWVEVQIRTKRMDLIAEKGHASHWRYKENSSTGPEDEWLREIWEALESGDAIRQEEEIKAKTELYSDQIYVFTPKGDLLKLKSGSTVLDFAFGVHTDVGVHCTGAKVNGKIVPIKYILHNGDQIDILTSANQRPKSDWLNIVVSSKAKSRIKRILKEADYKDSEEGKEILKRKFDQWKVRYDVTTIHKLVNFLKLKSALDLYQGLAEDKINLAAIREWLREKDPAEYIRERPVSSKSITGYEKTIGQKEDYLVIDETLDQIDYKMAKCCNPIFGDEVFGFVTVKEGTKIHRIKCPNAQQMIQRYPYRVVKVRWTESHGSDTAYHVNIQVSGIDDIGIVNDISKVISTDLKVSMRGMKVTSKDEFFDGTITLIVNDKSHLESIMSRLRKVKGVLNVKRSDETWE